MRNNYTAVLVAVFLAAGPVLADDMKSSDMNMKQDAGTMKKHNKKDCVMMKDGKMMVMKDGQTMPMDSDMTMTDGSMVMKDGTMMMKDGSKMMLKDGDRVGMDGKMMKSKKMMQK